MAKNLMVAALCATVLTASSASAATFVVDSTTNAPFAGKFYSTFNNRTLGNTTQQTGTGITVSFTGSGAFVQGEGGNIYSAPIVSNGNGALFGGQANGADQTVYVTSGIGSATLTLAVPSTYFGLLWGSIDSYNTLTFNTADGMSTTYSGSLFNGGDTTVSRYINFTSSSPILSVVASSTSNAFEFDNVALNSAVPESATWAMMIAGFGMVGFAMRRRRLTVLASYAA